LALFYLERITELQSFFQFARMGLETILAANEEFDFEEIRKIELG
jgi:hypothetical protein